MRVVVRHPATPPVDFDFVLELDPAPAVIYHVCEKATPGRVVVFDSDRFALGWCPSCQEDVTRVAGSNPAHVDPRAWMPPAVGRRRREAVSGALTNERCCGDPGDCGGC